MVSYSNPVFLLASLKAIHLYCEFIYILSIHIFIDLLHMYIYLYFVKIKYFPKLYILFLEFVFFTHCLLLRLIQVDTNRPNRLILIAVIAGIGTLWLQASSLWANLAKNGFAFLKYVKEKKKNLQYRLRWSTKPKIFNVWPRKSLWSPVG